MKPCTIALRSLLPPRARRGRWYRQGLVFGGFYKGFRGSGKGFIRIL